VLVEVVPVDALTFADDLVAIKQGGRGVMKAWEVSR
jgi:hypothetical protein